MITTHFLGRGSDTNTWEHPDDISTLRGSVESLDIVVTVMKQEGEGRGILKVANYLYYEVQRLNLGQCLQGLVQSMHDKKSFLLASDSNCTNCYPHNRAGKPIFPNEGGYDRLLAIYQLSVPGVERWWRAMFFFHQFLVCHCGHGSIYIHMPPKLQ